MTQPRLAAANRTAGSPVSHRSQTPAPVSAAPRSLAPALEPRGLTLAIEGMVTDFLRYYPSLETEREDLNQECWRAMLEARLRFDPALGTSFTAYLLKCAKGALLEQVRRVGARRFRELSLDGLDRGAEGFDAPDTSGKAAFTLGRKELQACLSQALGSLPAADRALFLARHHPWSPEAAPVPWPALVALFGTSDTTLRTRCRAIQAQLQARLACLTPRP